MNKPVNKQDDPWMKPFIGQFSSMNFSVNIINHSVKYSLCLCPSSTHGAIMKGGRCRNRLLASKFTSFLPHFSHTRLLIIYRCCNQMFVGFALCTYQTYADCPILTQTPCYPCRHPNCSSCHWAFPRQTSRCPQSQAEQH